MGGLGRFRQAPYRVLSPAGRVAWRPGAPWRLAKRARPANSTEQGSEGPTPAAHASRDTPTPSPRRVVVLGGVEGDDHPRRATKLTSDKRHQKENLTNKAE